MKKITLVVAVVGLVGLSLSSCGSSKGCKGNGSWYGKKNVQIEAPVDIDAVAIQEAK